jgi:hypothetical protein
VFIPKFTSEVNNAEIGTVLNKPGKEEFSHIQTMQAVLLSLAPR